MATLRPPAAVVDGLKQGTLLALALLVVLLPPRRMPPPQPAAPVAIERRADFGGRAAAPPVRQLVQWVAASADNGMQPFVVIDKVHTHVYVFSADGRLVADTPVLLGYATGDDSVAGIGQRPIADVRPEERTTPAGRFVAEPGRNSLGEDVIWVDYDAAVSMHRVRATNPAERRLERLATPTVDDNRISYGCINVPVDFFDQTLSPLIRRARPVVYVLPEVKPLDAVFPALRSAAPAPIS